MCYYKEFINSYVYIEGSSRFTLTASDRKLGGDLLAQILAQV